MDSSSPASPQFAPWHGVFETVKVIEGHPLFLAEHETSLREAAAALGLTVSLNFSERAKKLPSQTGRWRWIVTRDATTEQFQIEDKVLPESYSLILAPQRLGSENWDARYKTLSYLTHAQSRQWAEQNSANEAVLLNENGILVTAAMANLFWVRAGKIYTPALYAGCRNGVIRRWIIKNNPVEEGYYQPEVLDDANEIFLTNSMIGIMPAQMVRKPLPIGPVTRQLQKNYNTILSKTGLGSNAAR